MAPRRLAEKENALRGAGAHGKASVPERQGIPATSSMSGIRRRNSTGLERTCRTAAACRVDGGVGGEGRRQDDHRVAVNAFQVAVELALHLEVE
jgi:hypothetical protein